MSSHSSHYAQEVLLVQFSLYVHKGGLKPHSFHFMSWNGNIAHRRGVIETPTSAHACERMGIPIIKSGGGGTA